MPARPLARTQQAPLDRALATLKALNSLEDERGRALPSLVTLDGFEPWWFHQEFLYWRLLVPLEEERDSIERALSDGKIRPDDYPAATALALRRLAPYLRRHEPALRILGEPEPATRVGPGSRARQLVVIALGWLGLLLARLSRRDTVLSSVDSVSPGHRTDFRVAELDAELRRRGYRVIEYLFTRGADGFRSPLRNVVRRRGLGLPFVKMASIIRRPRNGQEPPRPSLTRLDPSAWSPVLRACALWGLERAFDSCAQVRRLETLLRWQGARRAVLLDNADSLHLAAACSRLGIPTLGFMHGQFNRYHPTLMAYGFHGDRPHGFDLYGVWSEYFIDRLERGGLYDRSRAFVCGPLRQPPEDASSQRAKITPDGKIRVLLVSESAARQDEVAAYLDKLADDERVHLALKIRPGEDPPHVAVSGFPIEKVEIVSTKTIWDAFRQADVVLGSYSSALYEAAYALRPTVTLKTSFPFGHELAEDELSDFARAPETVVDTVIRAASTSMDELLRRRRRLWGNPPGRGPSELLEVAEERLWRSPRSGR